MGTWHGKKPNEIYRHVDARGSYCEDEAAQTELRYAHAFIAGKSPVNVMDNETKVFTTFIAASRLNKLYRLLRNESLHIVDSWFHLSKENHLFQFQFVNTF